MLMSSVIAQLKCNEMHIYVCFLSVFSSHSFTTKLYSVLNKLIYVALPILDCFRYWKEALIVFSKQVCVCDTSVCCSNIM